MPFTLSRILTATIILALAFIFSSEAALSVENVNGTKSDIDARQIIFEGNPSSPILEALSLGTTTDITQTNGKIYVMRSGMPVETIVATAEENGAIAVVVVSSVYYEAGYLKYRINDRRVAARISIPVFEVPVVDGQILWPMALNGQIASLTLLPDDKENQWIPALRSGGMIAATVFLCVCALGNVGLATWKISIFVRYYGGFKTSIALYVLCIELFANIIRSLACLDYAQAYQLYPEWAVQSLMELAFPLAIISYMLFTLYWHEMMTNASVIVHPFITKMKIPFYVATALLLCLQITRSIVRNVAVVEFSLVTAIVYLAFIIAEVVFYSVTGAKILIRLHQTAYLGRVGNLRKTTVRIMIGASLAVLFAAITSLFVARIPFRPVPFIAIWAALTTALNAASLMNIVAFELPSKSSSKSSRNSTGPTTNTDN